MAGLVINGCKDRVLYHSNSASRQGVVTTRLLETLEAMLEMKGDHAMICGSGALV